VLINLSAGPALSQFHLQVVQPMGGPQPKSRGDAPRSREGDPRRMQGKKMAER